MIKQEFTHRKHYIAPKVTVMETEMEPLMGTSADGPDQPYEGGDGPWGGARRNRGNMSYYDELDETPETTLSIEHDSDIYY